MFIIIPLLVCGFRLAKELYGDTCNNFDNENACRGNQTDNDQSWSNRSFQTPPRGSEMWQEQYQDFSLLVGYARVIYTSGRKQGKVEVVVRVKPG